jgi:hypothetical protein
VTEKHLDLRVVLRVDPDADAQQVAVLEHTLCEELLNLGVEAAFVPELTWREAPIGVKAVGLADFSKLVVRFACDSDVLRSVVSLVLSAMDGQRLYGVDLTLDDDQLTVTGPRSVAQRRAVDLWIARHAM